MPRFDQVHLANPGYSGRQTQEEVFISYYSGLYFFPFGAFKVWRVWQSQAQVAGRVEAAGGKRSKTKSTKDPLAPKRPLTAKEKKTGAGCVEAKVGEVQENAELEVNMEVESVKAAFKAFRGLLTKMTGGKP